MCLVEYFSRYDNFIARTSKRFEPVVLPSSVQHWHGLRVSAVQCELIMVSELAECADLLATHDHHSEWMLKRWHQCGRVWENCVIVLRTYRNVPIKQHRFGPTVVRLERADILTIARRTTAHSHINCVSTILLGQHKQDQGGPEQFLKLSMFEQTNLIVRRCFSVCLRTFYAFLWYLAKIFNIWRWLW